MMNDKNRNALELIGKYFDPILWIAAMAIVLHMCSCKKTEPENENVTLNFTMYSQHPKFTFKYVDADQMWHIDTIKSNTHSQTIIINEASMSNHFTISGVDIYPSDSVYIRCNVNGLKVEQGMKVLNNASAATVQPSQAH
jgi:hypothetical protein